MLTAKCNNEIVIANNELSKENIYYCRGCGDKLIFKNGQIKIPHFAHSKNNSCDYYEYSKGESEEHQEFKLKVLSFFQNNFDLSDYQLEYRLIDGRICDLYIELKTGFKFVVEIQYTKISYENFVYRTLDYNKNNIPVLWIFNRSMIDNGYNNNWKLKQITPKNFFRYIILKDNISYFMDGYSLFKGLPNVSGYDPHIFFTPMKEANFIYNPIELSNYEYELKTAEYKFQIDKDVYNLNFVNIDMLNYKETKRDKFIKDSYNKYVNLFNEHNHNYYNKTLPYTTNKTVNNFNLKEFCSRAYKGIYYDISDYKLKDYSTNSAICVEINNSDYWFSRNDIKRFSFSQNGKERVLIFVKEWLIKNNKINLTNGNLLYLLLEKYTINTNYDYIREIKHMIAIKIIKINDIGVVYGVDKNKNNYSLVGYENMEIGKYYAIELNSLDIQEKDIYFEKTIKYISMSQLNLKNKFYELKIIDNKFYLDDKPFISNQVYVPDIKEKIDTNKGKLYVNVTEGLGKQKVFKKHYI